MAVPKYRTSKAKSRSRRSANMKVEGLVLTSCGNCGKKTRRHYVCPSCGFYRGKQVLNVEKDTP